MDDVGCMHFPHPCLLFRSRFLPNHTTTHLFFLARSLLFSTPSYSSRTLFHHFFFFKGSLYFFPLIGGPFSVLFSVMFKLLVFPFNMFKGNLNPYAFDPLVLLDTVDRFKVIPTDCYIKPYILRCSNWNFPFQNNACLPHLSIGSFAPPPFRILCLSASFPLIDDILIISRRFQSSQNRPITSGRWSFK